MIFARELKAWRKRAKLSQSQAAVKLGIPAKTLQNWEHGRNIPNALATESLRAKMANKPFKIVDEYSVVPDAVMKAIKAVKKTRAKGRKRK